MADPVPPAGDDDAFLGQGWGFPPSFGAGGVRLSSGEDDIHEALRILFGTAAGERFLRPDFGLSLRPLLFEPMGTTQRTELAERLTNALLVHEPRIRVLGLAVESDTEGSLRLRLDYAVRSTNSRFNLVFPFYAVDANEHRSALAAPRRA